GCLEGYIQAIGLGSGDSTPAYGLIQGFGLYRYYERCSGEGRGALGALRFHQPSLHHHAHGAGPLQITDHQGYKELGGLSLDELEEIKKKKMEKMMREINKRHEPTIEQPGKPIIITDATVDAASNQYPLLILDCCAETGGPCRMIGPIIEDLAA